MLSVTGVQPPNAAVVTSTKKNATNAGIAFDDATSAIRAPAARPDRNHPQTSRFEQRANIIATVYFLPILREFLLIARARRRFLIDSPNAPRLRAASLPEQDSHMKIRPFHWSRAAGILVLCAASGLSLAALRDDGTPQTDAAFRYSTDAIVDGTPVAAPAIPMGDPETIRQILLEGRDRNQVMDHLKHFTKSIGSRLTGSSRVKVANDWCRSMYELWGLTNPRLEQWGTVGVGFDRGPSSGKVFIRSVKPADEKAGTPEKIDDEEKRTLAISTLAWTRGTSGPVRAGVIKEPKTEDEFAAVKDKIKGSWLMLQPPPPVGQRGLRDRLKTMYDMRADARKKIAEGTDPATLPILERIVALEPAGYLTSSRDERVWTGGVGGWRELTIDTVPPEVHVMISGPDYDYINSRLFDKEPIVVELDLKHEFTPGPIPVYNTIAEIRGTEKPDEYVIVSAHLDSWDGPGSEGATDNGTGSSVVLEAARILAAVGAKPKRTIKFINWTGEEQGLLGSKGWVDLHPDKMDKISAVLVDDGGTNYEGGLHGIASMRDYLAAATAPVNNLFFDSVDNKPLNVNIRIESNMPKGGGSDHATFNAAGVPGFFWDEVGRANYGHGWHTQFDRLDLAIPEYLHQSATCMALTAYQLACAPTLLPREPKAEPKPETKPDTANDAKPEANPKSAADKPKTTP